MKYISSLLSVLSVIVVTLSLVVTAAHAHGVASNLYEAKIKSITPADFPIDVQVRDRDQIRVENVGSGKLMVCGYDTVDENDKCEPYARVEPGGVWVNKNTSSYYANLDTKQFGEIPDDAGKGAPKWDFLRKAPLFFRYHDHRIHWMGGKVLPPGVDASNPKRQKVNNFRIDMRYNDKPVWVEGTLYYIGGQTWMQRYGEFVFTGIMLLAMVLVFLIDVRKRRKAKEGVVKETDTKASPVLTKNEDGLTILGPDK